MLESILAPTDFSSSSRRAVRYAARLASHFDGALWVLHVSTSAVVEHEGHAPGAAADIYHRARAEQSRAVHQQMDELVSELSDEFPGLEIHVEFHSGVAHTVIIRAAEEIGADLIVMGTAGLTGLSHLLIGSTAERVVRQSSTPVLTVRGDK